MRAGPLRFRIGLLRMVNSHPVLWCSSYRSALELLWAAAAGGELGRQNVRIVEECRPP